MKILLNLLVLLVFLILSITAIAQDAAHPSLTTQLTGLNQQQQLYVTWGILAFKYLAEFYSAVRNGGGLVRIFQAFLYGENLPKVIANDYKSELSKPPFPPPAPPAAQP